MLKKLLKYEWKDTRKLLLPINLTIVVLTAIGCALLCTSIFDSDAGSILAVLFMLFYIFALIAFSSTTIIYLYVRFYKNLYTREGYLMHTLPVTEEQLFHSKFIIGNFWFCLNSLLTLLSTMALGFAAGLREAVMEISEHFSDGTAFSFEEVFGSPIPMFLFWVVIVIIVSSVSSILMGYASVLLGQQLQKNKLAASIGFYFAFYMVIQIISSIVAMIPSFAIIENNIENDVMPTDFFARLFQYMFPVMTVFYLALGIALYIVCRILLKRKVNLD